MVQNPPPGQQRIIPYLTYPDANAAIEQLKAAFGFEERFRIPGPDGTVGHAELGYGGDIVMLADLAAAPAAERDDHPGQRGLICVYVDDVDAHHARASAAGVTITREPADQFYGDRTYAAVDAGGHTWYFHQHVRDVSPEDMAAHSG